MTNTLPEKTFTFTKLAATFVPSNFTCLYTHCSVSFQFSIDLFLFHSIHFFAASKCQDHSKPISWPLMSGNLIPKLTSTLPVSAKGVLLIWMMHQNRHLKRNFFLNNTFTRYCEKTVFIAFYCCRETFQRLEIQIEGKPMSPSGILQALKRLLVVYKSLKTKK